MHIRKYTTSAEKAYKQRYKRTKMQSFIANLIKRKGDIERKTYDRMRGLRINGRRV